MLCPTLTRIDDLPEKDRAAVRALSQAVYPPDEVKDWPGRAIAWARPEYCVRVHGEDRALVTYVGVVIREGTQDGKAVRIGGIGGVMTHPAARKQGHAERGMKRAIEFFNDEGIDFALLVCEPRLLGYYGRQGWQELTGELLVRQRGEASTFRFNKPMTLAVRSEAPTTGTIDLCGPPW